MILTNPVRCVNAPPTLASLGIQPMSRERNAESSQPRSGDAEEPPSPTLGRSESSSSKPSSPADAVDFRFLNFAHPQDAKNAQTRRSVRSHVTARQHQNTRRAAAEQAQKSQSSSSAQSYSIESETSSPEASSAASSPTTTFSPSQSPQPPVRINPLEVYPPAWQPHLRPVMVSRELSPSWNFSYVDLTVQAKDHYLTNMVIDVPEVDKATREVLRSQFLALVFTDPAPLHALMLVAAAHYARLRGPQSHTINLLQLRGMAIQEINRALVDQRPGSRATSDQLVVAVQKMATYELLFGAREIFHTHMTGLQRIVSLRRGFQSLGLDGFLERALLWIDSNAAHIAGIPLYFPPTTFPSSYRHPQPDRRLFVLGLQGQS